MVISRDSQRRVDQALCAAAEFWDSGPDWTVLPWWIVGCAAGSLGESAAEEEQEQDSELLDPSERYSGASEEEMLLAGRRRGQTGSQ